MSYNYTLEVINIVKQNVWIRKYYIDAIGDFYCNDKMVAILVSIEFHGDKNVIEHSEIKGFLYRVRNYTF